MSKYRAILTLGALVCTLIGNMLSGSNNSFNLESTNYTQSLSETRQAIKDLILRFAPDLNSYAWTLTLNNKTSELLVGEVAQTRPLNGEQLIHQLRTQTTELNENKKLVAQLKTTNTEHLQSLQGKDRQLKTAYRVGTVFAGGSASAIIFVLTPESNLNASAAGAVIAGLTDLALNKDREAALQTAVASLGANYLFNFLFLTKCKEAVAAQKLAEREAAAKQAEQLKS